ncbi:cytochrome P450 [Stereum hirsutum FP-91666 SS1]|uniref:cytochrome P450 n=1 Tax=Stereum hirsutum (strain FP-91666) TaxID=721885 RepID=UPI000444A818|nr:cytochrome P450 [Stereum hirsutum FP-91666 SS1]EIM80751.1 cytochrome P450 [Stereum hirsutum FP-91666 SS1]
MIGKSSWDWLGFFFPAFDLITLNACRANLIEGSSRYPSGWFRIHLFPFGTTVVANGPELVDELCNAPDDAFSLADFAEKILHIRYTISPTLRQSRYHIPIVRNTLTRNLGVLFSALVDEMNAAFADSVFNFDSDIGANGRKGEGEWRGVVVHRNIMKLVCRVTNRVVVGAPLCRNREYRNLNIDFTMDVAKRAVFINLFPAFLHRLIGPLLSKTKKYQRQMRRLVGDMIEERKAKLSKDKHYEDKPNDYLMWLIEQAPSGAEGTTEALIVRLLQMNFSSIHATSMTLTHAIFYLATYPEYIPLLRAEADAVISEDGWTKKGMQRMRRLDSFLRESSRINAVTLTSLNRYALRDYTFQDGTFIPKGTFVTASLHSLHMNDGTYEDAEKFDPWRFVEKGANEEVLEESMARQFTSTSAEYLAFGSGKHVCPGRFFAANEIKAILCYFILNYDLRLPGGVTERPPNQYFGTSVLPNQRAEVLFRPRRRA